MPAENLKRTWENTSGVGDVPERVNAVAGEMGVSAPACKWRLRNIGLLSRTDVEAIDDGLLGARDRRTCRNPEVSLFSRQFLSQIGLALDAGRFSVRRAAKLLGVSMTELAQILQAYGHKTYFEA